MQNTSGMRPVEYNVLVKQDEIEEQTNGGIFKPQDTIDADRHRQTRGVIVALSPMAFDEAIWPDDIPRPEPGTRIAFERHAGEFVKGDDGEEYRIIKDKSVAAVFDQ